MLHLSSVVQLDKIYQDWWENSKNIFFPLWALFLWAEDVSSGAWLKKFVLI